ncbi:hypothetical protein L1N85_18265 [Paenibacillus alkaliterrae]|uniref:hypothetical protein n=1 Tax=Paenibacillus alkaliterrae TaxID=320909 RepID=UPI001F20697E|nr:hypothetical protein [Paenibacillus alkaliterrae]MCF2940350.1 hypothetical protein [Paenibacillus alkaliterrae]
MTKQSSNQNQPAYLFNVEVLVEGKHNAAALERLLHALNSCGLLDYRILSGIQLGKQIDDRKEKASVISEIPIESILSANVSQSDSSVHTATLSGLDKIRDIKKNNTLIRLLVNKGLGIKLSIPCRIINIDEIENLITVYHVDEKQVYTFRLNEIEDFSF